MADINVVSIVISYLIPTILGAVIGFITARIKKNQKEDKALKNAVLALLRNEIIRRFREYECKGEISILDKENLEEMFKEYKNLGGNGTVKELMTELMRLPIKIIKE